MQVHVSSGLVSARVHCSSSAQRTSTQRELHNGAIERAELVERWARAEGEQAISELRTALFNVTNGRNVCLWATAHRLAPELGLQQLVHLRYVRQRAYPSTPSHRIFVLEVDPSSLGERKK